MLDPVLVEKASAFELFSEHIFTDRQLLLDALACRGYPNEHPEFVPAHRQALLSNLGDTVIDLLCTEFLILQRKIEEEGEVTVLRNRMVKRSNLNKVAAPILPFLAMTSGEENEIGHSSTAGESLEAVVGALYLDGGLDAARHLLVKLGLFEQEY